jgi:F-type H+-transporting ATPase subunit gamma
MAQEREIATRITSLSQLLEIVAAIRAIAATQMQQALLSLEAIRRYSDVIREALSETVSLLPPDGASISDASPRDWALIVFAGEHGLCGGFNDQVLRGAELAAAERPDQLRLIVVGSRGAQICNERGLRFARSLPMATHSAGVTATARRVAAELYSMFSQHLIAGVEVLYTRPPSEASSPLERHRVLPLEESIGPSSRAAMPPLLNLPPQRLFDDLAAEYFFAALENAAMQSFFSENATRFQRMEAAYQNIQNKTGDLNKLMRRLRQEAVTTEILDLVSGVEAIRSSDSTKRP